MGFVEACAYLLAWAAGSLLAVGAWLWASRLRTAARGPPPLPLIGNLLSFRKLPVLVGQLRALQRAYGNVFRFYMGPKLFMVVTQPDDVQKILTTSWQRERDPYFIRPVRVFVGEGLLTSKGDVWRNHRKIIEPTFHTEVLSRFVDSFNEGARFTCEKLAAAAGTEVDVYGPLFHAALRTFTSTIAGIQLDEIEPDQLKQAEIADEVKDGLQIIQKRLFRPWMQMDWVVSMTPEGRAFRRQIGLLNGLVGQIINVAKKKRNGPMLYKRNSLIDVLLDRQRDMEISEGEVHEEVCTFALASTETTAAATGFTLSLLALYPVWQDAVHRELDEVFGTGEGRFRSSTAADIARLAVLDCVVKETLRLFPIVPNLPHLVTEDTPLDGGRCVAPRGACVLVALSLLHRQPDSFPEPDRFDPGRFLKGGSSAARHPYSYLPFGTGSRKCVGGRFALLQMKTQLAAVLRRFHVLPGSSRQQLEEVALSITGQPVSGLRVAFVPRHTPSPAAARS
ncbi:cytochrome P450 4C1-like [Schistocerca gregaria]|uniref:cytochrome P450 4C1-like n=1 Tax=Schistocerca gregaria TaxID=7010 RepID=UPI00211E8007|nr:cytochrome P450 4C1-like [Schistocerca gregaria]